MSTDQTLYDIPFIIKNSYQQSVGPMNGPLIGGRYPSIVDICGRLKTDRERSKAGILYQEQQHRASLDAAREQAEKEKEEKAEKARLAKETKAAKAAAKKSVRSLSRLLFTDSHRISFSLFQKRKSKAIVEDDEGSVFDDSEFPAELTGTGEVDDPMLVDNPSDTVRSSAC
jgi:hypothetical protein